MRSHVAYGCRIHHLFDMTRQEKSQWVRLGEPPAQANAPPLQFLLFGPLLSKFAAALFREC